MSSTDDKNVCQKQFTATNSKMLNSNSKNVLNDFTKQFATYWNPSTERRYENWLQTQRMQFHTQNEYDHSFYQLKSAFTCTNQFTSSFSTPKQI